MHMQTQYYAEGIVTYYLKMQNKTKKGSPQKGCSSNVVD